VFLCNASNEVFTKRGRAQIGAQCEPGISVSHARRALRAELFLADFKRSSGSSVTER